MAIAVIGDVYDRWTSAELEAEANRAVGRGLKAALIFLAARVREILSVPAPRVRIQTRSGGEIEYRAGWLDTKGIVQGDVSPFERNKINVSVLRKVRGREELVQGVFTPSPATPFAPPRKLSGHLRRSITWEISDDGLSGRVGTNVDYGRTHELGNHKFLKPTLMQNVGRLVSIIGRNAVINPGSVGTS